MRHRRPTKHHKSARRTIALLLALLFWITGSAQALPEAQCKKACCQNRFIKRVPQQFARTPSAHPMVPFERGLPVCGSCCTHGTLHDIVSQKSQRCPDEALPACCKAESGSKKVQGPASASTVRTQRHPDIGLVSFADISDHFESLRRASFTQFVLPARAAPPPLYIKYSAFLC